MTCRWIRQGFIISLCRSGIAQALLGVNARARAQHPAPLPPTPCGHPAAAPPAALAHALWDLSAAVCRRGLDLRRIFSSALNPLKFCHENVSRIFCIIMKKTRVPHPFTTLLDRSLPLAAFLLSCHCLSASKSATPHAHPRCSWVRRPPASRPPRLPSLPVPHCVFSLANPIAPRLP